MLKPIFFAKTRFPLLPLPQVVTTVNANYSMAFTMTDEKSSPIENVDVPFVFYVPTCTDPSGNVSVTPLYETRNQTIPQTYCNPIEAHHAELSGNGRITVTTTPRLTRIAPASSFQQFCKGVTEDHFNAERQQIKWFRVNEGGNLSKCQKREC